MKKKAVKKILNILTDVDSQLSMFLLENTQDVYEELEDIDDARERINDVITIIREAQ